jgi:hypothetical protein
VCVFAHACVCVCCICIMCTEHTCKWMCKYRGGRSHKHQKHAMPTHAHTHAQGSEERCTVRRRLINSKLACGRKRRRSYLCQTEIFVCVFLCQSQICIHVLGPARDHTATVDALGERVCQPVSTNRPIKRPIKRPIAQQK